mmetsp:Transcript_56080/g.157336  ORF Transcript_56080/g.157336 Transcript_56080/m.157336 type:complete len:114 (+) Transcript_56080:397-738(+)
MMKSCSTTKAVFLLCMMKRLITLAQLIRCSESRYALGSSIRYTSAGVPKARVIASRWSSPPERVCTPLSMMLSITRGFITSEMNWGCTYASRTRLCNSCLTVPSNLGEIFCGL